MSAKQPVERNEATIISKEAIWAAALFALLAICLQAWRSHVLLASYDQGIFQQVLWNSLRGHFFESTLSSQLSTNVIHAAEVPSLAYQRLGQHFTPSLILWAPLVGLIGGAALPLVQVGLITAAGLVLHRLARDLVPLHTANWITYGFFGGNALIGPTLGNFTDLCQLPLAVFALMLGLQERRQWLIGVAALLIPLIREDTGILLVAIGFWLLVRHRRQWLLALMLISYGGGWMVLTTSTLMPLFSDDNSKRFMVENFGQYLEPSHAEGANSLTMLKQALQQPLLLLKELGDPPLQSLLYLLGQSLPFLFVPLISLDSWILAGPSLLGLFLAQGSNDPLSITIRYTLLVVPGFALGALFWWQRRPQPWPGRLQKLIWRTCIVISLMLTISSNPHRSLSFVIPDSIKPWVYSSPIEQWNHGTAAREALAVIPSQDSVAATTPLVPLLARREVVVRYPFDSAYIDRQGNKQAVEWITADLDWLERYGQAFRGDWKQLRSIQESLSKPLPNYRVQALNDGVVVLQRDGIDHPELEAALQKHLSKPLPEDPRKR